MTDITTQTRLDELKKVAIEKQREAEIAWHQYACELPVSGQREWAFTAYERIRTATRIM
jgi:hypothetical protein